MRGRNVRQWISDIFEDRGWISDILTGMWIMMLITVDMPAWLTALTVAVVAFGVCAAAARSAMNVMILRCKEERAELWRVACETVIEQLNADRRETDDL